MADRHDLLIRIDSQFEDRGFKSAQQSAQVLARELNKQEQAERSLANMQMAAAAEDKRRHQAQLSAMASVGRGFLAMGAAAAVGLGLAGKAAMDWESAWAGVTKTADGSKAEVAALEGQLRDLARTLPATHEEIAGVAEAAGQLGVKARDIAGFTKTMIDLGVSTNLSAEEAATGLAQLGNIMGVLPSQADHAGAALVALGNNGASTEADILAMSLRIAGAGKTIGLTEAQVMGFANALASMGIEAESGGSGISRVMITIAQAVAQGGDKLAIFAKVAGVTVEQFRSRFQTDAAGAVASFIEGLGRMNASGQAVFSTLDDLGLGEIRVRDTLLRAANAQGLLTASLDLGTKAWAENSALVNEANKRYETAESRLKIARNQLNDAAIDLGANLLPMLAGATDRVGFLAEAFRDLPDGVKTGVTILGGAVATLGLVGGAALILIPKLAELHSALLKMGTVGKSMATGLSSVGSFLTGPWGLALGAATLAVGVWAEKQYQASQRAEEFRRTLDTQTGAITDNTRAFIAQQLSQQGILDNYGGLVDKTSELTDAALGNESAMRKLADAQKAAEETVARLSAKHGDLTQSEYDQLVAAQQQADMLDVLRGKLGAVRDEYAPQIEKQKELTEATGGSSDATSGFTKTMEDEKAAADEAKRALDELIASVEDYGSSTNDALDAASDYYAAVDAARASVEKYGETVNKSRTALNLSTEAGRANDKTLRDVASSALASATANFQNGDSVKQVAAQVDRARARFIEMATKMGLSKEAANKLADQLGLTRGNVERLGSAVNNLPKSKTITVSAATAVAMQRIGAVQAALATLPAVKSIWVAVSLNTASIQQARAEIYELQHPGRKAGALLAYAEGGYFPPVGNQQPQIRMASGGGLTWAEQGAGPWEAFISGNPAYRLRNLDIYEEVGRRLGAAQRAGNTYTFNAYGPDTEAALRKVMAQWQFRELVGIP